MLGHPRVAPGTFWVLSKYLFNESVLTFLLWGLGGTSREDRLQSQVPPALDLVRPLNQGLPTWVAHWNHPGSFKNTVARVPPQETLNESAVQPPLFPPRDCNVQPRLKNTALGNRTLMLPQSRDSQMEAKSTSSSHGALVLFRVILGTE